MTTRDSGRRPPPYATTGLSKSRRTRRQTRWFYATDVSGVTMRMEDWAMASAKTAHRLPLLARMAKDIDQRGSIRSSTAAAMWAAYAAHTALTG